MYCLLRSANRKGWDLLGVRQGGAGGEVEKISRSVISNTVRGGENSSQEENPRGEQLWGRVLEHEQPKRQRVARCQQLLGPAWAQESTATLHSRRLQVMGWANIAATRLLHGPLRLLLGIQRE